MIIDKEFRDLIPPLSKDEYNQLKENIRHEGWRENEAIITWNNIIIDGHHRNKICEELGIIPKYIEKDFQNRDEVKIWMINNQKGRRNLTDGWKWELAQVKKDLLLEKGKEEQKKPWKNLSSRNEGVLSTSDKTPSVQVEHNTQKELAKELSWSKGKVAIADKVWKKADEETKEKIKKGDLTFNKVYSEIRAKEKKEERLEKIKQQQKEIEENPPENLKGKYEVIVVDPPWKYQISTVYDTKGFRGITDYPTMSVEEIKKIKIPAADNCVLWLWTTHRFMRYAFELLDEWGFQEKAILTWVKNKMGIGRWLRSKSEFCIMAIKGKPTINLTNQTTVLNAKNTGHSIKPDEFYEMVEKLCIGRKVDIFARKKRDGWDVWGDEVA